MIKRFKLSYKIYNLFQKKKLIHNEAAFKKYGIKKRYYSSINSTDFPKNVADDLSLNKYKFNEIISGDLFFKTLDQKTQDVLLNWSDKGYAVLDKYFNNETVDKINNEVAELIKKDKAYIRYGGKIMFAIHSSAFLKSIGEDPKLKGILKLLLQKEAVLFQSINFLKGSEQKTHSDSIHMSSFPLGNLVAIWVALEDIDETNGALHYYEGSHQLPYYMNPDFGNEGTRFMLGKKSYYDYENMIEEKIVEHKQEKTIFRAKKGDIFIWHANLLHGGEPHLDKTKTRKSMVFHYFGEGAVCYHEVTQRPALITK